MLSIQAPHALVARVLPRPLAAPALVLAPVALDLLTGNQVGSLVQTDRVEAAVIDGAA
jgi:hypothetical protein